MSVDEPLPDSVPGADGVLVAPGDRLAYAALDGRSAGLRTGRLLSFQRSSTAGGLMLRVAVDTTSSYWTPTKPTLIGAHRRHFVKLNPI